jgi:hypothetical protein
MPRMTDAKVQVEQALEILVGLQLSIARNAASLKNLQFGAIKKHLSGKGTVGQYALHIQCPWRIVRGDCIITGSSDYYEPTASDRDIDELDGSAGTLQDKRFGDLLKNYDADTNSWVNGTDELVVQSISADKFCGLDMALSGGFRLQIVPCGSRGEDWRFFVPGTEGTHLVIEGGQIAESLGDPE